MVFEAFRRRQKGLMIALAIGAMFIFVLGGTIDSWMSRQGGPDLNYVVATAWGEDITAADVDNVQAMRHYANRFVFSALRFVGSPLPRESVYPTHESAVIESMVIAEKGRRMGLNVTDKDVTDFIDELTQNKLSGPDFRAILSGAGPDSSPLGVSETKLYEILKRELLIQRVFRVLTPPVIRDTPLQVWERVEPTLTNVQLKLVEVPVDNYVEGEKEPDEAELQALYEKYKSDPFLNETLSVPHRIKVEYLVAKVDDFTDKVTVSDEEIQKYYDENKSEFEIDESAPLKPIVPAPPAPKTQEKLKDDAKQDPSKPVKTTPIPAKSAPEPKPDSEPSTKPGKENQPKRSEPKPKKEQDGQTKTKPSKAESKASKAESKPKATDDKPEQETKKAEGSALFDGVRSLAAAISLNAALLQEESDAPKTAEDAAEKVPAQQTKPQAKTEKAEETPKQPEAPETSEAAEGKPSETNEPQEKADAAPPGKAVEKAEAKEPEYKPLSEVRDEIATKIKRSKAQDRIRELFEKIEDDVMRPYRDEYSVKERQYRRSQTPDEQGVIDMSGFEAPAAPDLSEVAKQYNLEFKQSSELTPQAAIGLDGLGVAVRDGDETSTFRSAFFSSRSMYRARVMRDTTPGAFYLVWKTQDDPAHVKSLKEARDLLVEQWRLEQARPKAKEAADELAEKVRQQDGNISEVVKGTKHVVATTGLFSKLTRSVQANPLFGGNQTMPTQIPEVPDAGAEFLDAVFAMKKGDVTVLPDQSEKNYYIVQVVDRVEPDFSQFVGTYNFEMTLLRRMLQFANQGELQRTGAFNHILMERQRQYMETRLSVSQEADLKLTERPGDNQTG